jgi:hypothetical protein
LTPHRLANHLIHHPGKLEGVSCDLCRQSLRPRAGGSGFDNESLHCGGRHATAVSAGLPHDRLAVALLDWMLLAR